MSEPGIGYITRFGIWACVSRDDSCAWQITGCGEAHCLSEVGVSLGWGTPAMPDRVDALLYSLTLTSLCITLGLRCGAVGGALARPRHALQAFIDAQQRDPS